MKKGNSDQYQLNDNFIFLMVNRLDNRTAYPLSTNTIWHNNALPLCLDREKAKAK